MTTKYPNVKVQLAGKDGSAPAIVARCRHAAEHAGISALERDTFMQEAFSGDYDNVIEVVAEFRTSC